MSIARCIAVTIGMSIAAAGCAHGAKTVKADRPVAADWKTIVTARDLDRIRNWRTAFLKALASANAKGNARSVSREGALLDPDASVGGDTPPAGDYRCRTIKIGSTASGPAYIVYPEYACAVRRERGSLRFTGSSGMQRASGAIYANDAARAIFLGTMMVGDEKRPMAYGRDSMRDMAGAVERIGPARWRMILPYPSFESMMDIIEITPVTTS